MSSEGFLEELYQGRLDRNCFDGPVTPKKSERVRRLVDGFQEIVKRRDPVESAGNGAASEEMIREMGEIGLFGISIPVEYGGLGFSLPEYLAVVEEMTANDLAFAMATLAHLSIGCKGIQLFGNESQKRKYLTQAASGKMIFAYALTEPLVGSDARNIQTRAEISEDGAHFILNGQKTYITNANYAGAFTTFAQLDPARPGTLGAFIVERAWEGVGVGREMPKMGLKASSTAPVRFTDVRVPVENLLGARGDGFRIAMTVLNYGRLGLGAASVGVMKRSLEDMKKRSSSRIQFGTPIKNFPLIQEKMVKAKVYSFVSDAMNDFAAGRLEKDPVANIAIESSHCKLFGTTRGWDVVYDALQVAGGAGYLSTQPFEKRMRDFRVTTVFEGTTEIHSIYPALFLLRKMNGVLGRSEGNRVLRFYALLRRTFRKVEWPSDFDDTMMKSAARFVKSTLRVIKRMLLEGILIHGAKMSRNEFLLRRITTLSLYAFGVLAVLAKLSSDRRNGRLEREELNLLSYFLEEAREVRKRNRGVISSKKEALNYKICGDIWKSAV